MKKIIVLLSVMIIFITGCSIISINDVDTVVDNILLKNVKLNNTAFDGYKYYVPRGLTFINKDKFNAVFKDKSDNKYYLYVDAVSYYHNVKKDYKEEDNVYYSKALKSGKKFGYLEINKTGKKYFIQTMYNYAKIETYVDEKDLIDAVTNISYILSSIKYNHSVLETLVGDNVLDYKEEEYDIFKSKRKTGDFLDYVEEYGKYYDKDNELPDQDKVEIEEEK